MAGIDRIAVGRARAWLKMGRKVIWVMVDITGAEVGRRSIQDIDNTSCLYAGKWLTYDALNDYLMFQ